MGRYRERERESDEGCNFCLFCNNNDGDSVIRILIKRESNERIKRMSRSKKACISRWRARQRVMERQRGTVECGDFLDLLMDSVLELKEDDD